MSRGSESAQLHQQTWSTGGPVCGWNRDREPTGVPNWGSRPTSANSVGAAPRDEYYDEVSLRGVERNVDAIVVERIPPPERERVAPEPPLQRVGGGPPRDLGASAPASGRSSVRSSVALRDTSAAAAAADRYSALLSGGSRKTLTTDRSGGYNHSAAAAAAAAAPIFEDDLSDYNDRFLAGYDKGRLLGRGACAVVWLAAPTSSAPSGGRHGGVVAVKQVAKGTTGKKKADTEAARKEICFGDYLFHPGGVPKVSPMEYPGISHIAKLLDYSETKRDVWIVMEFGGTCLTKMVYEIKGEFNRGERIYRVLHLPLMQGFKRDISLLKRMMKQLLSAICVISDHHIVHSDIKPDNILIDDDEKHQLKCRFIDFGSSFAFDRPDNLALATPEYMPPEALETCMGKMGGGGPGRLSIGPNGMRQAGRKAADPVAKLHANAQPWSFDIWSLGAILLELALGTPLWLSYKCLVADDQRGAGQMGLFGVPGRAPEKILLKQAEALRQKGLDRILERGQGVQLGEDGIDLLASMLTWDPIDRISPREALDHPFLRDTTL